MSSEEETAPLLGERGSSSSSEVEDAQRHQFQASAALSSTATPPATIHGRDIAPSGQNVHLSTTSSTPGSAALSSTATPPATILGRDTATSSQNVLLSTTSSAPGSVALSSTTTLPATFRGLDAGNQVSSAPSSQNVHLSTTSTTPASQIELTPSSSGDAASHQHSQLPTTLAGLLSPTMPTSSPSPPPPASHQHSQLPTTLAGLLSPTMPASSPSPPPPGSAALSSTTTPPATIRGPDTASSSLNVHLSTTSTTPASHQHSQLSTTLASLPSPTMPTSSSSPPSTASHQLLQLPATLPGLPIPTASPSSPPPASHHLLQLPATLSGLPIPTSGPSSPPTASHQLSQLPATLPGLPIPTSGPSSLPPASHLLSQLPATLPGFQSSHSSGSAPAGAGSNAGQFVAAVRDDSTSLHAKKGRIRRALLDLKGLSDSSKSSLVVAVTIFFCFIGMVKSGVQAYRASLQLSWFLLALAFAAICLASLLSYTSTPPMGRCIANVNVRAEELRLAIDTALISEGDKRSFHDKLSSILNERRIIMVLVLIFWAVCATFAIYQTYQETAQGGPEAPPPDQKLLQNF